jgi:pyruvate decarboxylase
MSASTTIARYLFRRLGQLGAKSIHGVPGDFNLPLLDHIRPAGLRWIGNANELNGGYAADGYARIKGIGALITTFGVGELSAINAIAGAYVERSPVVHIVGCPSRSAQKLKQNLHHTFNDDDFSRFAKMQSYATIAQAKLWDVRTAPEDIDQILQQCMLHSRPVHLQIPVDMGELQISSERLQVDLLDKALGPMSLADAAVDSILEKLYSAKRPMILVDGEIRDPEVFECANRIIDMTKWPTWVTCFSKGLVDETPSNVYGIYQGDYAPEASQKVFKESDLILCIGPHLSSANTFGFSALPDPQATICINNNDVKILGGITEDAPAKYVVPRLAEKLDQKKARSVYQQSPELPKDSLVPFSSLPKDQPITQDKVWRALGNMFREGDIILGDVGTAGYGLRDVPLPASTRIFLPVTWHSIGGQLPASQGAALARRDMQECYGGKGNTRTILMIGDGSFQVTAQELATIIRQDLDVIVFVINNDGYTIERAIHGLTEEYNDIGRWNYLLAPEFFGSAKGSVRTATAKTWGELESVLNDKEIVDGKGLRMVELIMAQDDCPTGPMSTWLEKERARMST